jgi:hypothetical protein
MARPKKSKTVFIDEDIPNIGATKDAIEFGAELKANPGKTGYRAFQKREKASALIKSTKGYYGDNIEGGTRLVGNEFRAYAKWVEKNLVVDPATIEPLKGELLEDHEPDRTAEHPHQDFTATPKPDPIEGW